jgi:hypothetical protein
MKTYYFYYYGTLKIKGEAGEFTGSFSIDLESDNQLLQVGSLIKQEKEQQLGCTDVIIKSLNRLG